MLDRSRNILTWNAAAERVKAYRADEVIGRHLSLYTSETSEDTAAGKPASALESATQNGTLTKSDSGCARTARNSYTVL